MMSKQERNEIHQTFKRREEMCRPSLLDEREAGEVIRVKPSTLSVWRCTKKYNLPYVKMGGRVYYVLADLLAFVESRRVAAGS